MKSDRKSASSYGILSEREALRVKFLRKREAKKLLCYYALGRADRSFYTDVESDILIQFCGSVPTLLIIAGYELRRRGNTSSACNEILMQMRGKDRADYIVEIVYCQLREPSKEAFLNIACLLDGWERSRVAQIVGEMELRDLEGAALVTTCEDGKVIMHYRVKAVARNLRIPFRNPMCIVLTEQHIPMDEGLINVPDPVDLLHMNECLINPSDRALFTVDQGSNIFSALIQVREEFQDLTKTEGEADPPQLMVDIAYRQLEEPSQNAFLDIASYFCGWERSKVADIVGEMELRKLERAGLVSPSEGGRVMMWDIVKARGRELGQGSRIRDWESLRLVLRDRQKLKKIKGIWFDDGEYVGFLKCKHIGLMSKSLRILYLGASITGRWKRAFKELRFLHISYKNLLSMPPLKRLRKSELLSFVGVSLAGRLVNSEGELTITLPECLRPRQLQVDLPESLQLHYLKVEESNSSRLLHINGLFSSLRELKLGSFTSISESLGNYSALENLKLENCAQLKRLPQSFGNLSSLKLLDMSGCSMLEILPESFGNLSSLERLLLRGCSEFKKLPDTFGNLSSLKLLIMDNCSMLSILPDSFGNLSSLERLLLRGCSTLKKLPDTFGNLSALKWLNMSHCSMLDILPSTFGNLSSLEYLEMKDCSILKRLPHSFGDLCSLQRLVMCGCSQLERVSYNFCNLSSLKYLSTTRFIFISHEDFQTLLDRCTVDFRTEEEA